MRSVLVMALDTTISSSRYFALRAAAVRPTRRELILELGIVRPLLVSSIVFAFLLREDRVEEETQSPAMGGAGFFSGLIGPIIVAVPGPAQGAKSGSEMGSPPAW